MCCLSGSPTICYLDVSRLVIYDQIKTNMYLVDNCKGFIRLDKVDFLPWNNQGVYNQFKFWAFWKLEQRMTWLYNSSILFFRYGRHIFFWKNITYLYLKIFRYLNNFWVFFKSMLGELNMLHVTVFPFPYLWFEKKSAVLSFYMAYRLYINEIFLHLYSFNEKKHFFVWI